jgi:hypothetical protein
LPVGPNPGSAVAAAHTNHASISGVSNCIHRTTRRRVSAGSSVCTLKNLEGCRCGGIGARL